MKSVDFLAMQSTGSVTARTLCCRRRMLLAGQRNVRTCVMLHGAGRFSQLHADWPTAHARVWRPTDHASLMLHGLRAANSRS